MQYLDLLMFLPPLIKKRESLLYDFYKDTLFSEESINEINKIYNIYKQGSLKKILEKILDDTFLFSPGLIDYSDSSNSKFDSNGPVINLTLSILKTQINNDTKYIYFIYENAKTNKLVPRSVVLPTGRLYLRCIIVSRAYNDLERKYITYTVIGDNIYLDDFMSVSKSVSKEFKLEDHININKYDDYVSILLYQVQK